MTDLRGTIESAGRTLYASTDADGRRVWLDADGTWVAEDLPHGHPAVPEIKYAMQQWDRLGGFGFVCVGAGGEISVSQDGSTWTAYEPPEEP